MTVAVSCVHPPAEKPAAGVRRRLADGVLGHVGHRHHLGHFETWTVTAGSDSHLSPGQVAQCAITCPLGTVLLYWSTSVAVR